MSSPITSRIQSTPFYPLVEPRAQLDDGTPVIRLNLNESPFPPADSVVAAMVAAASGVNRYPDGEAEELIGLLASSIGVDRDRVFVGSGSNELLAASADITLDPGATMIAPDPGFPTYRKLACLRGANFVGIDLRADGSIDVDAMLAAVTPETRLMFVSSPHNPTGAVMTGDEIARLASGLPDHVLLHFDEAYYEFGHAVAAPDALAILKSRNGPWLSTRTFSKAYGLAGIRVGYGIAANAEIARSIRKARPNFSLNTVALAAACAAFSDRSHAVTLVENTLSERRRIIGEIEGLGYKCLPGAANFVAILPPFPAKDLADWCSLRGILINVVNWGGINKMLRVTIGRKEDNDAFVTALRDYAAAASSTSHGREAVNPAQSAVAS